MIKIVEISFTKRVEVNPDSTLGLTSYVLSYDLDNGKSVTTSGQFYDDKNAYENLRNEIEVLLLNQEFDENPSAITEPGQFETPQVNDNPPSLGDQIRGLSEKLSLLTDDVRDLSKNLGDELERLEERVKDVENKGVQTIPWSWPSAPAQPSVPMPDPVTPVTPTFPTYPNYPWITWQHIGDIPWWLQYTTTCSADPNANGKK